MTSNQMARPASWRCELHRMHLRDRWTRQRTASTSTSRTDRGPRRSARRGSVRSTTRVPSTSAQMEHQIDRVGDLVADRLIRQLDTALDHARGEPRERLLAPSSRGSSTACRRGQCSAPAAGRTPPRRAPRPTMMRSGRCRSVARSRSRIVTAGRPACSRRASKRTRFGRSICSSAVSSMRTMRSLAGRNAASAFSSVVLPVLVPPLIRMFSFALDRRPDVREHVGRQRADPHQFVRREEPRLELANGQRRAADAARREDRGHARAVRQARVEDRLLLRDVVAERAGDVLHGDLAGCVRRAWTPSTSSNMPVTLDEDRAASR